MSVSSIRCCRRFLRIVLKLVLHRETKQIDAYILETRNEAARLENGDGKGATTDNGRGNIVAMNATMDRFAEILSRQMDRPVVNHTGFEGVFNLTLKWTYRKAPGQQSRTMAQRLRGPRFSRLSRNSLGCGYVLRRCR